MSFLIRVGVRHVWSLWLFNTFLDGCMREIKAKVGNLGARLKMNGIYVQD